MTHQQTFNWTWPATRRVSRALRFPDFVEVAEGKSVKRVAASVVRSVMAAIEDHAGLCSWATVSNDTLWKEASVKPTHGKRALRFLDAEGFLIRSTRYADGHRIRSMRPNWQQYLDSDLSSLTVSETEELLAEITGQLPKAKVPESRPKVPEQRPKVPEQRPKVPERKPKVPPEGPTRRSVSLRRNIRPISRCSAADRVIGFKFSEGEVNFALELIDRISSAVDVTPRGDFDYQKNHEAMAKLAVLTVSRGIPEAYLAMALEAINAKSESCHLGYLIAVIRNRCRDAGDDLGQLLKHTVLPRELRWVEDLETA